MLKKNTNRGFTKGLDLGRSKKADHPSAKCFLCSVNMQKVVHGESSRIFLEIESSYLRDRKILAPCKLPSLGRS